MNSKILLDGTPTSMPTFSPVAGVDVAEESSGYSIGRSIQFNGSQHLEKFHSVESDRRDFTFATMFKVNTGAIASYGTLLAASVQATAVNDRENLWYASGIGELWSYSQQVGTVKYFHQYNTDIMPADGWVHICAQKNTDTLTYTIEVNSAVAGFTIATSFADHDGYVGSTEGHRIGQAFYGAYSLSAKLADTHLIIGANYDASYFINQDLTAKEFTESHGLNGAHFLYNDAGNLGKNEVGEDWTAFNNPIQTTDVP